MPARLNMKTRAPRRRPDVWDKPESDSDILDRLAFSLAQSENAQESAERHDDVDPNVEQHRRRACACPRQADQSEADIVIEE